VIKRKLSSTAKLSVVKWVSVSILTSLGSDLKNTIPSASGKVETLRRLRDKVLSCGICKALNVAPLLRIA